MADNPQSRTKVKEA